ncbi:MAG: TonB family protein, partial [Acidobacteriota bacterium]
APRAPEPAVVPPAPPPAAPIPSTLQQAPFGSSPVMGFAAPAADVPPAPPPPREHFVETVAAADMFALEPSGGIEHFSAVEAPAGSATEVVSIWQGTVIRVDHYAHKGKPAVFSMGEDPKSSIYVMPELLGGSSFVQVVSTSTGGSEIHLLPGMTGSVRTQDGTERDLMSVTGGASHFALPGGARAHLDFGDFTFLVNSVLPGKVPPAPLDVDWSAWVYTGFSFLVHAAFMFLVYFIPPDPRSLSLDMLAEDNRFVRYILEPPEIQQEEVEDWVNQDNRDDEQGGKGKRHKGEEGQMGRQDAKKSDNRFGIKGPADNPDPHMARERAKEYAASAGILSVLRSAAPTSPFGQDSALGNDPENALGALMGNQIGDNFGYGGLGLRGTGRGGGGTGEGTIGLGNLATIGHGGGGGSGSGYGRGAGGLRGRRASVPEIRTGTAAVRGSLSKEVIRRYIRRNINQIRFCYEQQLARRPDLSGRVAIQFVISPSGAVSSASVAGSTLGEPAVEQCVARAVERIAFPQPEGGGVVIVTYPFMFQSAEGE